VDPEIVLKLTCDMRVKDMARQEVNKAHLARQRVMARELNRLKNGTTEAVV